jgi:hypothetical protein
MAILEGTAISNIGATLCKACYRAEGDSPLMLTGHDIITKVESVLTVPADLSCVQPILDSVLEMLKEGEQPMLDEEKKHIDLIAALTEQHKEALIVLEQLQASKEALTSSGTSRTGRNRRTSNRATDTGALEALTFEIIHSRGITREAEMKLKEAKRQRKELMDEYNAWKVKFPYETHDDLLQYCQSMLQPVIEYYDRLFRVEQGDYFSIRKCLRASQLFNPFFLVENRNDIVQLNSLADDMVYFECNQFSNAFISCLKREIPRLVQYASLPFQWHDVESSSSFKTRMQKRLKRCIDHDAEIGTWMDDPGEKASRIWYWWKTQVFEKNENFPEFKVAVRIVVLFQTSSCAVERVFSRLKNVRETCGDSLYEDMLEVRMMMQCNGDLDSLTF